MSSTSGATPLLELADVAKDFGGEQPLRIDHLQMTTTDRVVLTGLGPQAAEMLMHLICGAILPDAGRVAIEGVSTADIRTDQEWLRSLDRFGLVSQRAVLLDGLPALANLAMPLTLSIDPMDAPTRAAAESMGRRVELPADRLAAPAGSLVATERLRLHLGRALIQRPRLLLLEHPTATLTEAGDRAAFGRLLAQASAACGVGWLAVSNDDLFVRSTGGRTIQVDPVSGSVTSARRWWDLGRRIWSRPS